MNIRGTVRRVLGLSNSVEGAPGANANNDRDESKESDMREEIETRAANCEKQLAEAKQAALRAGVTSAKALDVREKAEREVTELDAAANKIALSSTDENDHIAAEARISAARRRLNAHHASEIDARAAHETALARVAELDGQATAIAREREIAELAEATSVASVRRRGADSTARAIAGLEAVHEALVEIDALQATVRAEEARLASLSGEPVAPIARLHFGLFDLLAWLAARDPERLVGIVERPQIAENCGSLQESTSKVPLVNVVLDRALSGLVPARAHPLGAHEARYRADFEIIRQQRTVRDMFAALETKRANLSEAERAAREAQRIADHETYVAAQRRLGNHAASKHSPSADVRNASDKDGAA